MKKVLLAAILSLTAAALWARQTSQGSTDADTWCTGPSNKEVCTDKNGAVIPTVTNNQDLGTSGLKWNNSYITTLNSDSLILDTQLRVGSNVSASTYLRKGIQIVADGDLNNYPEMMIFKSTQVNHGMVDDEFDTNDIGGVQPDGAITGGMRWFSLSETTAAHRQLALASGYQTGFSTNNQMTFPIQFQAFLKNGAGAPVPGSSSGAFPSSATILGISNSQSHVWMVTGGGETFQTGGLTVQGSSVMIKLQQLGSEHAIMKIQGQSQNTDQIWFSDERSDYSGRILQDNVSKVMTFISTSAASGGATALVPDGGWRLWSRTMAQLLSITPLSVGEAYYCNNCSPPKAVISTGTSIGNFADAIGGQFK